MMKMFHIQLGSFALLSKLLFIFAAAAGQRETSYLHSARRSKRRKIGLY